MNIHKNSTFADCKIQCKIPSNIGQLENLENL